MQNLLKKHNIQFTQNDLDSLTYFSKAELDSISMVPSERYEHYKNVLIVKKFIFLFSNQFFDLRDQLSIKSSKSFVITNIQILKKSDLKNKELLIELLKTLLELLIGSLLPYGQFSKELLQKHNLI